MRPFKLCACKVAERLHLHTCAGDYALNLTIAGLKNLLRVSVRFLFAADAMKNNMADIELTVLVNDCDFVCLCFHFVWFGLVLGLG